MSNIILFSLSFVIQSLVQELKQQGILEDKLQLLVNVTGAFRPGVLTALVGISGAGKTTLMDVLAGRKTGGVIEGSICISGFPKKQETFARISGYCEQNDVHSPCLTVLESLLFSAWLRLPSHVDLETQRVRINDLLLYIQWFKVRYGSILSGGSRYLVSPENHQRKKRKGKHIQT